MVLCCVCCFLVNSTATTGIDTHCHPLPLHDALPISIIPAMPGSPRSIRCAATHRLSGSPVSAVRARAAGPSRRCSRSEEHTPELQSLMRRSYAVFCLKKKSTLYQRPRNCNYHSCQQDRPIHTSHPHSSYTYTI